jgi:hypothetical protein
MCWVGRFDLSLRCVSSPDLVNSFSSVLNTGIVVANGPALDFFSTGIGVLAYSRVLGGDYQIETREIDVNNSNGSVFFTSSPAETVSDGAGGTERSADRLALARIADSQFLLAYRRFANPGGPILRVLRFGTSGTWGSTQTVISSCRSGPSAAYSSYWGEYHVICRNF